VRRGSLTVIFFILSCCFGVSEGFYNSFSEEPFINLMTPKPIGKNKLEFCVQHDFTTGMIDSADFRLGYGASGTFDIYLASLYNYMKINIAGHDSSVEAKENELSFTKLLRKSGGRYAPDMALRAGVSSFLYDQVFDASRQSDSRYFYLATLLLSRDIKNLFISASPTLVYDAAGKKTASALMTGIKYTHAGKVSLVLEYPLLLANPYGWKQPWSIGLQFRAGPHIITLFATDTYGFTAANILQGFNINFYGFRFSY
jgi:hypothetical protein